MRRFFTILAVAFTALSMNAQIVYTDHSTSPIEVNGEYELSLMNKQPFMIQNYAAYGEFIYMACMEPGAAVISTPKDYNALITNLDANVSVQPGCVFWGYNEYGGVAFPYFYETGNNNFGHGYVGFKFSANDGIHYGWLEIEITQSEVAKIYGWAYQQTPETAIKTGDKGEGAVNDVAEINVAMYPNPATDMLTIEANNIQNIKVLNSLGQVVINTNETQINVSSLENAMYFVEIATPDGILVKKFIKR